MFFYFERVNKQPANKQIVDRQPANKQPVDKQPVDKQPANKQPVNKQPIRGRHLLDFFCLVGALIRGHLKERGRLLEDLP